MKSRSYLLDTQIVMWMDHQPQRISPEVRHTLNAGDRLCLSAASTWEAAIKRAAGGLQIYAPLSEAIERFELTELPVTIKHSELAGSLPRHHGDPFDRLLVAQAMTEDLVLVTADPRLTKYEVQLLLV